MKKLLFIAITILIYSCNKSQITESNNITKQDKLTQTQTSMQTKPITYELIKDLPIENVIKEYPPVSEEIFILGKEGGFITEFRAGLANVFREEDIRNKKIKIKEVTWAMNDRQNLTVWYNEKENTWTPVDHFIWDKEAEF